MATGSSLYTELAAMTRESVMPGVTDAFFVSTPLLARWANKSFRDGGDFITKVIEYENTDDVVGYIGDDILPHVVKDKFTRARWNWKFYAGNVTLLETDLKLNMNNPHTIADMLQSHGKNAMKSFKTKVSTDIFSTGTTAAVEDVRMISGLRAAVTTANPTTWLYGGITRTGNTYWQAGLYDTTTTGISKAVLDATIGSLTDGSERPTLIVTTQANWNYIHGLIEPQKRYQDTEMATYGFRSVLVEGIPMVIDAACPTNHVYFLNENYIEFITLQGENMRVEDVGKPHNQEVRLSRIYWAGNLIVHNPKRQGVLTAIAGL